MKEEVPYSDSVLIFKVMSVFSTVWSVVLSTNAGENAREGEGENSDRT